MLRKRGAVDIHQCLFVAVGRLVDGAGNEFLAGSGFAGYQHGFGVTGYEVNHAHEFMHDRAGNQELGAVDFAPRERKRRARCAFEVFSARARHADARAPRRICELLFL